MDISSLISVRSADAHAAPASKGQFEFAVNRADRKFIHRFDPLSRRELARVHTGQAYTWPSRLDLPDTSSGTLREVACTVQIEGVVPGDEAAARSFLATVLNADFDFTALATTTLKQALANFGNHAFDGRYVAMMRRPADREAFLRHLAAEFNTRQLAVQRVIVTPHAVDSAPLLDLQDDDHTLEIRCAGDLRAHRVGYRVRLAWGSEDAHWLARLTYRGTIAGKSTGAALPAPLVPGQVQPLEAWLRQLLAAALSQHDWPTVCAARPDLLTDVAKRVSQDLGAGTGRVVQNLLVSPVVTHATQHLDKADRFVHRYSVQGMSGQDLEVEHSVNFRLVDEDRWHAAGSPALLPLITECVVNATRLHLLDKHFEDAVALYLNLDGSVARLDQAIAQVVSRTLQPRGCELQSLSLALRIPHADFVHGRRLDFAEGPYPLADAHVVASLTIQASVKLVLDGQHGQRFASALAREVDLQAAVAAAIDQQVRERLRSTSALAYYMSPYVNGVGSVRDNASGQWQSLSHQAASLHTGLVESVNAAIAARFGLQLDSFSLVPGRDTLVERLRELSRLPIQHQVTLSFERGAADTEVQLHADATLFVASIDPPSWDSFLANARRLNVEQHRAAIVDSLRHALALLEPTVVEQGAAGLRTSPVKRQVIEWFTRQMREEQGLDVLLRPLRLRVRRPGSDPSANLIRESLTRELALVLGQREKLVEKPPELYGAREEERSKLNRRIDDIRRELQVVAAEHETLLGTASAIVIEQAQDTGLLLEGTDPALALPRAAGT